MKRLWKNILRASTIVIILTGSLAGKEVLADHDDQPLEVQEVLSLIFNKKKQEMPKNQDEQDNTEERIHEIVYQFGNRLKMVSLLAPDEVLRESILDYYGDLVTPKLLKRWLENPRSAPGRYTSSPWPERIDIADIKRTGKEKFEVRGHIVEVTSTNKKTGEFTAKRPILLEVIKIHDQWLINDVELADYQ